MQSIIKKNLNTLRRNLGRFSRSLSGSDVAVRTFDEVAQLVSNTLKNGGRVYVFGNGGSAADADHLAGEFVGRLYRERNPLPAESLTGDIATLTAIANDYGYDQVFVRQLRAKLTAKDVVIGITTSGNSDNVVKAMKFANRMDVATVLLTGPNQTSRAAGFSDYVLGVPGDTPSEIQELHTVVYHSLVEAVENLYFKDIDKEKKDA